MPPTTFKSAAAGKSTNPVSSSSNQRRQQHHTKLSRSRRSSTTSTASSSSSSSSSSPGRRREVFGSRGVDGEASSSSSSRSAAAAGTASVSSSASSSSSARHASTKQQVDRKKREVVSSSSSKPLNSQVVPTKAVATNSEIKTSSAQPKPPRRPSFTTSLVVESPSAAEKNHNNNNDNNAPSNSDHRSNATTCAVSQHCHPFLRGGPHGISQSSILYSVYADQTRLFRILDGDRLLFYNDTNSTDFVVKVKFTGSGNEAPTTLLLSTSRTTSRGGTPAPGETAGATSTSTTTTTTSFSPSSVPPTHVLQPEQLVQEVEPRGTAKWSVEFGVEFAGMGTCSQGITNLATTPATTTTTTLATQPQQQQPLHFIIDVIQPGETQVFAQGKGVGKGYSINFSHRPHARVDVTTDPIPAIEQYANFQLPILRDAYALRSPLSTATKVFPVFQDGARLFRVHDGKKLYFYNDTTDKQFYVKVDFEELATGRPIKLLGVAARKGASSSSSLPLTITATATSAMGKNQIVIPQQQQPQQQLNNEVCTDIILPGSLQPFAEGDFLMSHFTLYVMEMKLAEKSNEIVCDGPSDPFRFNLAAGWDRSLVSLHHRDHRQHQHIQSGNQQQFSLPKFVSVFPVIFGKLYRIHDGDRLLFYNDTRDEDFEISIDFPSTAHITPVGSAVRKKVIVAGSVAANYSNNKATAQHLAQNQHQTKSLRAVSQSGADAESAGELKNASAVHKPPPITFTDVIYATKTQPFCKGETSNQQITVITHKKNIISSSSSEHELDEDTQHRRRDQDAANDGDNNDNNDTTTAKNLRRANSDLIDAATFDFHGAGPMHLNDSSRVFSMFEDNSKLFRITDGKNNMLYFYNDTDHWEFVVKVQFRIPKANAAGSSSCGTSTTKQQNDVSSSTSIRAAGTAIVLHEPHHQPQPSSNFQLLTIVDTIPPLTTHLIAEHVDFAALREQHGGYKVSFAQRLKGTSSKGAKRTLDQDHYFSAASTSPWNRQGRRHSTQMTDLQLLNSNSATARKGANASVSGGAQLQTPNAIKKFNLSGPYGITGGSSDKNNTTGNAEDNNDDGSNNGNEKQQEKHNQSKKQRQQKYLTFDCFDGDGMLFRIVTLPDLNKWYFYNDTVDAEMHVAVKFFGAKNLRKPSSSSSFATCSIVHSSDRHGDIDLVSDIILPGETNCFVEADEISKFTCNFAAKSVTSMNRKKMKDRAAPLIAEDRARFAELTYSLQQEQSLPTSGKAAETSNLSFQEESIDLCLEESVSFIDTAFPPTEQSIFRPASDHSDPGFVGWIRATTHRLLSRKSINSNNNNSNNNKTVMLSSSSSASVSLNKKIILDRQKTNNEFTNSMKLVAPHYVRDSAIGNQWLSCAIAILAEHPDFIRDVFTCAALRDTARRRLEQFLGVHRVSYIDAGHQEWWTSNVIDDFLPCVGGRSLCCIRHRTKPSKELWASLLEKLIAKLTGSYSAVLGGDPMFVFSTVTGFPCSKFDAKDFQEAASKNELLPSLATTTAATTTPRESHSDESGQCPRQQQQQQQHYVFSSFLDAVNAQNIVTISTKFTYFLSDAAIAVEEQALRDCGLELDRSYAVVDMKHFPQHGDLKLVKIRNAWYYGSEKHRASLSLAPSTGRPDRDNDPFEKFSSSNNVVSGTGRRGGEEGEGGATVAGRNNKWIDAFASDDGEGDNANDNDNDNDDDDDDEAVFNEGQHLDWVLRNGWTGPWSPTDRQWSKLDDVAEACGVHLVYPGAENPVVAGSSSAQRPQLADSSSSSFTPSASASLEATNVLSAATTTTTKTPTAKSVGPLERQRIEKERQEARRRQLQSNKHSLWIEWRDLLRFANSGGICYCNRSWSNYRLRSQFSSRDGTAPVALKVRCKQSMENPVSVIFSINQPGLPPLASQARGGRPYLSVALAMLAPEDVAASETKKSSSSSSSSSSSTAATKYSVKLVSGKIINLPTHPPTPSTCASATITHFSAKHIGFKYEFAPPTQQQSTASSSPMGENSVNTNTNTNNQQTQLHQPLYYYIVPHCDIVLPDDDPKALSFSLCYYAEGCGTSDDERVEHLEVQFVQIQNPGRWFDAPADSHDLLATPVDEDYQFKKSGHRPVARHGWTFD